MKNLDGRKQVSVIIPTLDEAENIDYLLERLVTVLKGVDFRSEIIIADGGSGDGTRQKVGAWNVRDESVFLVSADSRQGLAGDVLAAAHRAQGDVVVVMDADLSHAPEIVPLLVEPVRSGNYDIVVGSRYVQGGETPDWPWIRKIISRIAGFLAYPLINVKDPTSGFFAVRRENLLGIDSSANGFKIALEVLLAESGLRVKEIPICFRDRSRGSSKMNLRQAGRYLCRLAVLYVECFTRFKKVNIKKLI